MLKLTRSLLTVTLFLVVCFWTIGLGWGMASALDPSNQNSSTSIIFAQTSSPKSDPTPEKTSPSPKKSDSVPTPTPSVSPPAVDPSPKPEEVKRGQILSVDPIPTRYEPGFQAYLETCATCHIAIPPEVLPTESWREILRKPDNHFGVVIPNYNRLTQLLIWDYISTFSRPLPPDSPLPLYVEKSRHFKALHPNVTMPPDMNAKTCINCHPNVTKFDFRTLTPEWNDKP